MRIIAGRHRGTKLAQPASAETRPTADRVRESLFNILDGGRFGRVLDNARVIDAFAGTGALGLEALSRGAAASIFIERDPAAIKVLRSNIARLDRQREARIIAGDALTLASWRETPANLALIDAPYNSGHGLNAAVRLLRLGAFADDALIVIETANDEILDPDLV
ncbi:MAG: 16S rRNA (guanine(966)-N(2))-methyltransferase RsmD [Bacteroidetes bacterium]|nr:16S rRNA (guanine(966)-N(2))-methyltransferase RsmD [Bacteroidota bacterium]